MQGRKNSLKILYFVIQYVLKLTQTQFLIQSPPPPPRQKRRLLNLAIREFKLEVRVIRQTTNDRQRKILRYQAIKNKWTCCFKMHDYYFDTRKKIWNENVQRKFCQESSNLPFAVPGNAKLKLPINPYALYFIIILFLTTKDFTCQGESASVPWVHHTTCPCV